MVPEGGSEEWLFEQNSVDPRRVAAYRINHSKRQILVYDESDLKNRMHIRGWADILTMRFPATMLESLRPTREREHVSGVTFERYVRREAEAQGVVEVWWSEALLLPLSLTLEEGGTRTTSRLEGLLTDVPDTDLTSRLADPRRRFPGYEVLEASDLSDHRN
jgi:hypothetical protein